MRVKINFDNKAYFMTTLSKRTVLNYGNKYPIVSVRTTGINNILYHLHHAHATTHTGIANPANNEIIYINLIIIKPVIQLPIMYNL